MLPNILPQYVGIKVWKIHSFHLSSHHLQNLDRPLFQIHYNTELSEVRKYKVPLSSVQHVPLVHFLHKRDKSQHWPQIYLLYALWVSAAPLDGHQDTHVCKSSSLQMDSSHGLHQNTCMACCWKGKYHNSYSQHTRLQNCIYLQTKKISSTIWRWSVQCLCEKVVHYVAFTPKVCVGWGMHRGTDGFHSTSLCYLTTRPPRSEC